MNFDAGYAIYCVITLIISYILAGLLVVIVYQRRDRVGFYRSVFLLWCIVIEECYKFFTYTFVLVDVLYSTAFTIALPFWMIAPGELAFFSIAPWNDCFTLIQVSYQVWFTFFVAILLCITCSFVYRYGLLCCPQVVSMFERPRRFVVLCLILAVISAFWIYDCNYLMFDDTENIRVRVQKQFGEEFGSDFMSGYMLTVDLHNERVWIKSSIGAVILISLVQVQLVVMSFCGWKIHITVKKRAMSEKLRKMHKRALNMLIAQTFNQLCFLFITTSINLLGMFINVNFILLARIPPSSFTLFPVFNPIIVIYFTEGYKRYLFGQASHVSAPSPAIPITRVNSANNHSNGTCLSDVSTVVPQNP